MKATIEIILITLLTIDIAMRIPKAKLKGIVRVLRRVESYELCGEDENGKGTRLVKYWQRVYVEVMGLRFKLHKVNIRYKRGGLYDSELISKQEYDALLPTYIEMDRAMSNKAQEAMNV